MTPLTLRHQEVLFNSLRSLHKTLQFGMKIGDVVGDFLSFRE